MTDSTSSTSAFVSSLIFNGCLAAVFTLAFLTLRPRDRRVYEPRTLADVKTVKEEERTDPVPAGYFKWVPFLLSRPHSFLMQHASVEGYFFLRYIALGVGITFVGCILLFPILLPVNATNGRNYSGFELLSFANVTNKNRFFAHVFMSWLFFGIVVFIVYRELYYYVMVRHALQTSPLYDSVVSSRTLVITELHKELLDEQAVRSRFPQASRFAFARDESELQKLCKERAKCAKKLEGALNKVINKSVKRKRKADEKVGVPALDGDELETYVPAKKRPTRRLGKWKIPFLGTKVDTLEYDPKRIGELNEEIHEKQDTWAVDTKILPVCFVQFPSQLEAQRSYQTIKYTLKGLYGRCLIGFCSEDIVWDNVNLTKPMRHSKRVGANTLLTAMIIFWSLPVAVVGCISNITFLTDKVHWLRFIDDCPKPLLGLITGILPAVALGLLMSLVPPVIMMAGKKSGCMTLQETDLYCQTWYYAFQVVQVFLVTTCTSSASATVDAIIHDPPSAMLLLANNLPKSSNFYIAYLLLQGLSVSSGTLLQLVTLILSFFLGRLLDSTPRQKWNRYCCVGKPTMGTAYPVIEVLVCVALCYALIAPLVLIFAFVGFALLYLANVYTLSYVQGFTFDTKGLNYPRALFQLFCGLYLAQVCLIGLFIMGKAWGPLVLEIVALVGTALAHIWFKRRFIPLFSAVPLSAIRYVHGVEDARYPGGDQGFHEVKNALNELGDEDIVNYASYKKPFVARDKSCDGDEANEDWEVKDSSARKTGDYVQLEADNNSVNAATAPLDETFGSDSPVSKQSDIFADNKQIPVSSIFLTDPSSRELWGPEEPVSWRERIALFFQPSKFYTFDKVRTRLPRTFEMRVSYSETELDHAFTDPSVVEKDPVIWVGEDPMGVSKKQIALVRKAGTDVTDANTTYNEKGKVQFTGDPPDFEG
ncbi:PHM7 (YOL084W) [Zygosaccharomyces parabailii]|nr:PHM7 (YOL084W) [Zygosaccharomyces parabailii]